MTGDHIGALILLGWVIVMAVIMRGRTMHL